jgi:flagellar biosynthesis protein FlhB
VPEYDDDKTEQPTEHRRQESRQRGQVAKSTDLSASLLLMGGMLALYVLGGDMFRGMHSVVQRYLGPDEVWLSVTPEHVQAKVTAELSRMAEALLPFLLVMAALAVAVNLLQVGFLFTGHPLMPSLSKIDPLKGLGRIFSKRGLVRLLGSLAKVAAIGAVATWAISEEMGALANLGDLGFGAIMQYGSRAVFALGIKLALVLIVLGVLDYAFQRWQHEQELKMTKQELKDEMRRMEGDPLVRERRRQMARRMAMARMAQAVPEADVVVTNPTELAVALKYDEQNMSAPIVSAKGAGFLARRIRDIAVAAGVPIVERKPLAQGLYKDVEVGREVPPQLFRAVAEVLAYVYELNRKTARPYAAV